MNETMAKTTSLYAKSGLYANTGYGPRFDLLDIGLPGKIAVVEPDTAFWAVMDEDSMDGALSGSFVENFQTQSREFKEEMDHLRFGLKPSAVYFNPTEQCNFNCSYCYLPEDMRKNGKTMGKEELCDALERLSDYFKGFLPEDVKPQIIFHGSEPMIAKEAMFEGISRFKDQFLFGVQTNASLLDDAAMAFLKKHGVGIGISLDAPEQVLADKTRKNWQGTGAFDKVVRVMEALSDYEAFNVITTVTSVNVGILPQMVDFYHAHGVKTIMLNPVRCTQKGGMDLKPDNRELAAGFMKALDRSYELYEETGQKIVVANFANVLAAIAGPTSRRLMCDISPCGGGRCFFALATNGDIFPCSEFIGFPEFKGGNIWQDDPEDILKTKSFEDVTSRKVEDIEPCRQCAIRHFCGAPCPAEVRVTSGTFTAPTPYCEFYEEQVRYAFRVLARQQESAYLWNGWQEETEETFKWAV